MGLVKKFTNKIVFLDTAPLIYYIEQNKKYSRILNEIFSANEKQKMIFQTSVITLMEVLVQPMREQEKGLVSEYKRILCNSETLNIYEVSIEIAVRAAQIRAEYGFKSPDALQLAMAVYHSADYFLTNDKRLISFKELEIIILEDNI